MKLGKTLQDIKKLSKKQSNKKNYAGWFQSFGGEAPIENAFFNMAMGTASTSSSDTSDSGSTDGGIGMVGSVGEDLERSNSPTSMHRHRVKGDINHKNMNKKEYITLKITDGNSERDIKVDKNEVIKALVGILEYDMNYLEMDIDDIRKEVEENLESYVNEYYDDLCDGFHNCNECEKESEDNYEDLTKYTFEDIDSSDPKVEVTKYESPSSYKFDEDWDEYDFDDDDQDDRFELIDRKTVYDSDGFTTDYSMYYDTLEEKYVMVFGDSDLYRPEDENYDAEFDDEKTAREWFDNYKGFEDEEDDFYECFHKPLKLDRNSYKKPTNPFDNVEESLDDDPDGLSELSDDFLDKYAGYDSEWMKEKSKRNPFSGYLSSDDEEIRDCRNHGERKKEEKFCKLHKEKDRFKYDDAPLEEGEMKNLDIEFSENKDLLNKLSRDIDDLYKELSFLKNTAPKEIRKGGAFESQEEIDDAVDATERALDLAKAKYKILLRRGNQDERI